MVPTTSNHGDEAAVSSSPPARRRSGPTAPRKRKRPSSSSPYFTAGAKQRVNKKRPLVSPASVVSDPSTKKRNGSSLCSSPTTPGLASAPKGWKEVYELVEELRQDRTAPVDELGCETVPHAGESPATFRFQVLLCLLLSSRTKDAMVAEAVRNMQRDGVCNVDSISNMSTAKLNSYLCRVGFHNHKTKFLQDTVQILLEQYDSDIPPTAAELMKLPGMGPKCSYICENVAWNRQSGIGVDTHMHRLFNVLGWVQSNSPEQTRRQLQAWLPRDKWADVKLLWVGFGQEVQQCKGKILRKALQCSHPAEALCLLKRCGLDYQKEGQKLGLDIRPAFTKSTYFDR